MKKYTHIKIPKETDRTYKEIKKDLKEIGLGVVKLYDGYFEVYFNDGIQKGNTLAKVRSLDALEEILEMNGY